MPFALTAGLSSLGNSKLVVLGGIAELIAGAISMGIGGFLASQAERDHYRYLQYQTALRVKRSCAGEMEREVAEILGPVGVDDKACHAVAQCLREVEVNDNEEDFTTASTSSNDAERQGLKWSKGVGLTAFLLRFGQGLGRSLMSLLIFVIVTGSVQRKSRLFVFMYRRLRLEWDTLSVVLSLSCPTSSSRKPISHSSIRVWSLALCCLFSGRSRRG